MESSIPTTASAQARDPAQARPHRFGIQNGLIYWGIVVLMASLLLWLGVELAKRIEWFLPYSGGFGLSLIAGGYLLELRKARKARASKARQPEPPGHGSAIMILPVLVCLSAPAQPPVVPPPQAIEQFQQVVGNRAEAAIILGGDYGAAGGIYSFRGGRVAELSVAKLGGGGDICSPRSLGLDGLEWAPVLQGNLGHFTADNDFPSGYLQGNRLVYDVLAVQGGAGARFYLGDHLSLAPTISGIYGHTENNFRAQNAVGERVKTAASGTFVDWTIDSWSVQPALDLDYARHWGRTTFELSSRYNYFHTESFKSTSPVASVNGDSHTWENKLDVDVPLGWKILGGELHTGGFVARTELFGGIAAGLNADHFYTVNGRFVLDLLGKLWKVRWLGVGASYFFSDNFNGWSAGLDLRFKF